MQVMKMKSMIVGAVVVVLMGALWYRVLYSPMESKASKAKSAAHVADTTATGLRRELAGLELAKKKHKDVTAAAMLGAIPTGGAEASFLRSVDALRVQTGADWQTITPSVPILSGSLTTVTVGITVQGTEPQLTRYLSGLSGLKRLFVVDTVNITGAGDSATSGVASGGTFQAGTLQMQVSGRIFSQPTAAPAPTGSGAATGTATPAASAPAPIPSR